MISKPASLPDDVWEAVISSQRLDVLEALGVMDADEDADFDRLTRLAAAIFGAPVSLVTVIDARRQWFTSHHGTTLTENATENTFCAHALTSDEPFTVLDATQDPRFANNPIVTGPTHVRFYAGVPVSVHGQKVGSICVIGMEPRDAVSADQLAQLSDLAAVAGSLFALKDEARVRARTAAELIKEEWRHALTLEAGKVGSWVWDIRTGEIVANDILRRMFGIESSAPVTFESIIAAIHPDDRERVKTALIEGSADGQDYFAEFRLLGGGWLIGRGRVYQRDAGAEPLIMMGVNIDVTDAREAAEQTRILLRELNHRVKNTLAMIQSLARQTLRRTPDPQRFIDAFSGRLRTLSEAHSLLADRDWTGIGILELIETQVGPYLLSSTDQLVIDGDDLQLPPDHALGLGLILHELASNAVKFGALSTPRGRIAISWTGPVGAERRVDFQWREEGGPQISAPVEPGFGTRLIERSLDKVLDSKVTLDYAPEGVRAALSFPMIVPEARPHY
ncbi:sensor histidine kinase [Arsenicitalea aurantiaca]|uniref:sensor histidine kinase n=1 Tax=Arsenicitalea aurantiaca TaxID=1783274 RepID=UPI0013155724|nr:HWE histidine kinase domain-containing protein [Arsenicitalea aurantiaca]